MELYLTRGHFTGRISLSFHASMSLYVTRLGLPVGLEMMMEGHHQLNLFCDTEMEVTMETVWDSHPTSSPSLTEALSPPMADVPGQGDADDVPERAHPPRPQDPSHLPDHAPAEAHQDRRVCARAARMERLLLLGCVLEHWLTRMSRE